MLNDAKVAVLQQQALLIRQDIIKMLMKAGSGHTAGPLGMADVFALLYFHTLRHMPEHPEWEERDRLVLSNGHICPVQYAAMARSGYFDVEELKTLRKFGSRLQGHPHREFLPGIEASSGPLGSGLSQALGMALAEQIDVGTASDTFFYCLMGDGELNEGQVWEAVLHSGKEKLHNLIAIIDRNDIQIDGFTHDVMPLEPLFDKWHSFGWHVQEVDGHNFRALDEAIELAKSVNDKPSVIIAVTVPGKGVAAFERKPEWHGKPPNEVEGLAALKELEETYA
jgi:transketolase